LERPLPISPVDARPIGLDNAPKAEAEEDAAEVEGAEAEVEGNLWNCVFTKKLSLSLLPGGSSFKLDRTASF
jgi:hypothetical protein